MKELIKVLIRELKNFNIFNITLTTLTTLVILVIIPFMPFILISDYFKDKKIKKSIDEDELLSEVAKLLDSYGFSYELDTKKIIYATTNDGETTKLEVLYLGEMNRLFIDTTNKEIFSKSERIRDGFGNILDIHSYKKILEVINPEIIMIDRDKKLNELI